MKGAPLPPNLPLLPELPHRTPPLLKRKIVSLFWMGGVLWGSFLGISGRIFEIENAPFVGLDEWGVVYLGSFPLSNICICSAGACGGR